MKPYLSGKVFVFVSLSALLIFLYLSMSVYSVSNNNNNNFRVNEKKDVHELLKAKKHSVVEKQKDFRLKHQNNSTMRKQKDTKDLKYILQWTNPKNVPFVYMGHGQQGFIDRKCQYINCFVTSDRNHLGDYTEFDVIAFAGPEVVWMQYNEKLPQNRSQRQKFVFTNIESADNYPVCSNKLDGFFNWTWTYKLDSESRWGYIIIRDIEGNIIGPNKDMHWMKLEAMKPITDELQSVLDGKTKTAAWFVSNCGSRSRRENFVRSLQSELEKYKLSVDIYGKCGHLKCSRDNEQKCDEIIEKDYHFYLAFENSFSEDYVTEKLLHALEYSAIPIVYGGANYSRFMPDGVYLDARELGVEKLAAKMNELIKDKDKYSEYFKWKNHYRYNRRAASVETDDYCGFCAILNEVDKVKETTIYKNFREWWDPPHRC